MKEKKGTFKLQETYLNLDFYCFFQQKKSITGDIVAAAGGNYTTLSITGEVLKFVMKFTFYCYHDISGFYSDFFLFIVYLDFVMIQFFMILHLFQGGVVAIHIQWILI